MAGEDLTSSAMAAPPRDPLPRHAVGTTALGMLADRACEATSRLGLRSWFWGEGVCLLGLHRLAEARNGPPPSELVQFVRRHARGGIRLDHVNNLAPGAAAAASASICGDQTMRGAVVSCLEWLEKEPGPGRSPNGALEHWPGAVWADTVFMAGTFLLHAGRLLDRHDLVAEAARQWVAHAEMLQDPASGLFAHGTHRQETIWSFWGRANAWVALAGVELCELVSDVDSIGEVRERLGVQLDALAALQPDHGVWDVLVDGQVENRGVLETSAAAGIGAALLRAAAIGEYSADRRTRYREAGSLAIRGALSYLDDGVLTRVSAGTVLQLVPFGYSVIRDDRPQLWGQGLALHAIAAALPVGLDRG